MISIWISYLPFKWWRLGPTFPWSSKNHLMPHFQILRRTMLAHQIHLVMTHPGMSHACMVTLLPTCTPETWLKRSKRRFVFCSPGHSMYASTQMTCACMAPSYRGWVAPAQCMHGCPGENKGVRPRSVGVEYYDV
jgi:hypothetical protein